MCEQKRRWQQEKDKGVQMGPQAYLRFYETSARWAKENIWRFCKQQYYNAFVKFGKHIIDIKAINPSAFINYVLTNNIKLDKFCKDENYSKLFRTTFESRILARCYCKKFTKYGKMG